MICIIIIILIIVVIILLSFIIIIIIITIVIIIIIITIINIMYEGSISIFATVTTQSRIGSYCTAFHIDIRRESWLVMQRF